MLLLNKLLFRVMVMFMLVFFICSSALFCRERYIGIMAGAPTAVFGGVKYDGADYELGFGILNNDFSLTVDKIYAKEVHSFYLFNKELPLRIGWGGCFVNKYHPQFGVRCVFNISGQFKKDTDLFVQLAPSLRLMPSYGINFYGGAGIKFNNIWAK